MSFYFYTQQKGGEEAWQPALADHRDAVLRDSKPAFVTVLDVDAIVDGNFTKEKIEGLKYRGPMYIDWDGALDEVIPKVQEFASKLEEMGVNINCVRWFATGGRGVHVEIPSEMFVDKPSKTGHAYLPAIYKEMMYALFTDCMDMGVYSGRRGRMWRTAGVQRDNGLYKVPLTANEVRELNSDNYAEFCAAPRHVEVLAPMFSYKLALIYATAAQKVENAFKNRKTNEGDKRLLAKFGGKFPATLQRIMAGETVNPDAGFHSIALQIGITANALGISEEAVLNQCEGLVNNHVSTGNRYNTPGKRKVELQRLLRYTADNPCYEFSKGAIKSISSKDADTGDLDGLTESTGNPVLAGTEEDNGLLGSLTMTGKGIYCKDAEGMMKAISNVSFDDICVMKTLPDGNAGSDIWGFELDVLVRGKKQGRKVLDNSTFSTKAKFNDFAMKVSGLMMGSDGQTNALTQLLHQSAEANKKVQYVVRREGLDLVYNPDTERYDLIWVGGGEVTWAREEAAPPYAYRGTNGATGLFHSTLHKVELLEGSDHELEVIRSMLKMNDPLQLGKLIGWMTSAFHRRIHHKASGQFPVCQVFGQAGSGKTQTVLLLAGMHYQSTHDSSTINADSLTPFAVQRYVINSSSMPVIVDEYKPGEIGPVKTHALQSMFRGVYNDAISSRGGGDDSGGSKDYRVLTQESLSAPVMFIAEALESQTAVVERSVIVSMSKSGISGREEHFQRVFDNKEVISKLGKTLMIASLSMEVDNKMKTFLEQRLDPARREAKEILGDKADARPVYNLATCLLGFDFFTDCVQGVFGDKLNEELTTVREALKIKDKDQDVSATAKPMAEAAKVIDALAYMSKSEDGFSKFKMVEGKDYCFTDQGGKRCVDLNMQACYIKYVSWAKDKGQNVLYANYEQFYNGLAHFRPRKNIHSLDSFLKAEEPNIKVYRFDLGLLADEGAGEFKGQ